MFVNLAKNTVKSPLNKSRPDVNIATGIQQAWSHSPLQFQEIILSEQVIDTYKYLPIQPDTISGFYEDGSMTGSVTNTVKITLRRHMPMHMGI